MAVRVEVWTRASTTTTTSSLPTNHEVTQPFRTTSTTSSSSAVAFYINEDEICENLSHTFKRPTEPSVQLKIVHPHRSNPLHQLHRFKFWQFCRRYEFTSIVCEMPRWLWYIVWSKGRELVVWTVHSQAGASSTTTATIFSPSHQEPAQVCPYDSIDADAFWILP